MKSPTPVHDQPKILSVTQLNAIVRGTLESSLDSFWVLGEISNLRTPPSGHLYFTLKDEIGQIRAALFRNSARRVPFELENGLEVVVFGDVHGAYGAMRQMLFCFDPSKSTRHQACCPHRP